MYRFTLALACLLAASVSAFAASQPVVDLIRHVQRSQWTEAASAAETLDTRIGRGDLMRAYVDSSRLSREGECEKATALTSALIKVLPDFVPAYESLAFCYIKAGQKQKAHAMYERLAKKLPAGAWQTMAQQNADALAPSYKPRINVSGSVAPSTNSSRQTSENRIGALSINDEAKAESGARLSGYVIATKPIFYRGNLSMLGALRFGAQYETSRRLLNPVIAFELPVFFQDTKTAISYEFLPFIEHVWSRTRTQTRIYGARAGIQRPLGNDDLLRLDTSLAWHNHVSDNRDGWRASAQLSWVHKIDENRRTTLSLSTLHNGAKLNRLSYNELSLSAEYEHRLHFGLIPSIGARAYMRLYDGLAPLSDEKQRDYGFGGQIGVSHEKVAFGKVRPELFIGGTIQHSNNPFYSHDALDGGIRFKARF